MTRISAIAELDALLARVLGIAIDVVQEKVDPYEGARALWDLSSALPDLPHMLLPFVGLASEWERDGDAAHRQEYERRIVVEMDRLRRRMHG